MLGASQQKHKQQTTKHKQTNTDPRIPRPHASAEKKVAARALRFVFVFGPPASWLSKNTPCALSVCALPSVLFVCIGQLVHPDIVRRKARPPPRTPRTLQIPYKKTGSNSGFLSVLLNEEMSTPGKVGERAGHHGRGRTGKGQATAAHTRRLLAFGAWFCLDRRVGVLCLQEEARRSCLQRVCTRGASFCADRRGPSGVRCGVTPLRLLCNCTRARPDCSGPLRVTVPKVTAHPSASAHTSPPPLHTLAISKKHIGNYP